MNKNFIVISILAAALINGSCFKAHREMKQFKVFCENIITSAKAQPKFNFKRARYISTNDGFGITPQWNNSDDIFCSKLCTGLIGYKGVHLFTTVSSQSVDFFSDIIRAHDGIDKNITANAPNIPKQPGIWELYATDPKKCVQPFKDSFYNHDKNVYFDTCIEARLVKDSEEIENLPLLLEMGDFNPNDVTIKLPNLNTRIGLGALVTDKDGKRLIEAYEPVMSQFSSQYGCSTDEDNINDIIEDIFLSKD